MIYVDTHCHLNYQAFQQDLESVIQRAEGQGVCRIVVPGLDLQSSREAIDLSEKYSPIYAAVGVYPGEVDQFSENQITEFREMTHHPKVVAVGEIGLDFYHRSDNKKEQFRVLDIMLEIASNAALPIILHSRNALDELAGIVSQWKAGQTINKQTGIFHAFEGTFEQACKITDLGFLIGAGGPVTYKNARIKQELFSKINLSNVVLETDAPFLSPQGHRGKRNEPGYIPIIAQKIAELQDISLESVADITTSNANKLLPW